MSESRHDSDARASQAPPEPDDDLVAGALRGLFGRDTLYVMLWGIQIVAAALVTPLLTRTLDVSSFGALAAAMAVMQVLFVLSSFGLYPAIQRQYARGGESRGPAKLLGASAVIALFITVIVDLLGPLWAPLVGFSEFAGPVRIAVWWAGASAITNSALALIRSMDRLLAFSSVSLLQSVGGALAGLILVVTVHPSATIFLTGQAGVQALAALLGLLFTAPRLPGRGDGPLVWNALAFGLPLVPAVLCTFVLDMSDRLIIQSQLGSASVGRYQVAYNVGSLPMLLLGVLNSSWLPRFFSFTNTRDRTAVLASSRDLLFRLLMPVLIGLAVGAPIVLRIWAPPSYDPSGLLLVHALVLVTAIPYTAVQSSMRNLMAEGRTGFIAIAQIIAATVNVGANFLLIDHYGLAGSAAATLVSFVILHFLLTARTRTLAPVRRPPARLLVALGVVAVFVIATSFVPAESLTAVRVGVVLVMIAVFVAIFLSGTGAVDGTRLAQRRTRSRGSALP